MADELDFPIFLFHVSEIDDNESEGGTITVPVIRLWITEDDFYDLNPDDVFSAIDSEGAKGKKLTPIEIFNNDDARTMALRCDFNEGYCTYYISNENVAKIRSSDDIFEDGEVELETLKTCLADFIVNYGKWADEIVDGEEAED